MPHSWIKIPNGASPAVQACMARNGDSTRQGFENCVNQLAGEFNGSVTGFWYETNGRWAHGYLEWPDPNAKNRILNLLQAAASVDVLSREGVDELEEDLRKYLD